MPAILLCTCILGILGQLRAQNICNNHDVRNAIREQNLMESMRPAMDSLIQARYQQTLDTCAQICEKKVAGLSELTNLVYTDLANNLTTLHQLVRRTDDVVSRLLREKMVAARPNPDNVLLEDFHLLMNETTFNPRTYLSRDRKSIFNSKYPWFNLGHDKPHDWPTKNNEFSEYYGVKGTLPIKTPDIVGYEVDVYYSIQHDLVDRNLLFELGIGRHDVIDHYHYIGLEPDFAWSFIVMRDDVTGSTTSACQSHLQYTGITVIGGSTAGTSTRMTLGVRVDTVHRTITVADRHTNYVYCSFTDVDVTEELWPVFGVYAVSVADVVVTLRHSFLISSRTWINVL